MRYAWRMPTPCQGCPFSDTEAGRRQLAALTAPRRAQIKRELLGKGGREPTHFLCHKTTRECGNGTNLVCAGALAFQEKHGVSSNYQRVCESIEYFERKRAEKRAAANQGATT